LYIFYLLLGIGLVGLASSTVFLFLTIFGALKFRRDARRAKASSPKDCDFPAVSLLKPVHGLDARLKENVESFYLQHYGDYEILFAADTDDDTDHAPAV